MDMPSCFSALNVFQFVAVGAIAVVLDDDDDDDDDDDSLSSRRAGSNSTHPCRLVQNCVSSGDVATSMKSTSLRKRPKFACAIVCRPSAPHCVWKICRAA